MLTEPVIRRACNAFEKLDARTFLRASDALHLACAAENGFSEIYSSDRVLLGAAPHFGLIGISVHWNRRCFVVLGSFAGFSACQKALTNARIALSPDISYPPGRKRSSPFEANEFQHILNRFYDYGLDRSLDRLKGLG